MPGFGDELSDDQIWSAINRIKSLQTDIQQRIRIDFFGGIEALPT